MGPFISVRTHTNEMLEYLQLWTDEHVILKGTRNSNRAKLLVGLVTSNWRKYEAM